MSEADEIVAEVVEIREDDDSLSVTYHCTCGQQPHRLVCDLVFGWM